MAAIGGNVETSVNSYLATRLKTCSDVLKVWLPNRGCQSEGAEAESLNRIIRYQKQGRIQDLRAPGFNIIIYLFDICRAPSW